ncbi:MAG: hypothetical protein R6X19_07090 [Kiritimatiellia bacterium]
MDTAGIVCGFLAALLQSLSYISSRWFLKRSGGTPFQLLGVSHLQMGLAALVLFSIFARDMPPLRVYLYPALGAIAGLPLVARARTRTPRLWAMAVP